MISGRQYLKVQGPRLMSTKDHRTSKDPVYNRDVRFGQSLEIFSADSQASANLGFELSGWPEVIHQGQIHKIDLVITNLTTMDQLSAASKIL